MRQMDQTLPARTNGALGDHKCLFTDTETLALRVGELDLVKARSGHAYGISRFFERRRNALADLRLEALRALVVIVGIAENDAVLEAACLDALASGLSETQIAFVLARHRIWPGKSRGRRGGARPDTLARRLR